VPKGCQSMSVGKSGVQGKTIHKGNLSKRQQGQPLRASKKTKARQNQRVSKRFQVIKEEREKGKNEKGKSGGKSEARIVGGDGKGQVSGGMKEKKG